MSNQTDNTPVGFDAWWNRADRPEAILALIEQDRPAFEAIWRAAQAALLKHQAASAA